MFAQFVVSAQSAQMSTLLHDGAITNFYSATALQDALNAANDGDIISLSSGVFKAVDITKNVTIRGAGISVPGFEGNNSPTVLTGDFLLNTPESDIYHLAFEGIYHNGKISIYQSDKLTANNCQFGTLTAYVNSNPDWNDYKFLHCIFNEISTYQCNSSSLNFINCVIKKMLFYNRGNQISQFLNCIISTEYSVSYVMMTNTILSMDKKSAIHATVEANSTLNNCIVMKCTQFKANPQGNKFLNDAVGLYVDDSFYQLTDEMKNFKGTDGTEVGIHGGNLPFTSVTSRPRITKFNVGSKTTADGKLSVDIEISGEE